MITSRTFAEKNGLHDQLIFTGFISNKELMSLYKYSIALIMPTFFGPTNIPPLEAFKIGVPVIYPDLDGLRHQVGDAALLMNLYDPNTLSDCLYKLIIDKDLRNDLINKGFKMTDKNTKYDRISELEKILSQFIIKFCNFRNKE